MATNEIANGCGLSTEAVLASNHKRRCVYTYRPDAQTCSQRCRKAYSRSPAGALARLKRLGRSHDEYKTDREWAAQKHARDKAWRQIMEDSRSGLKLKQARVPSQSNRGTLSI